MSHLTVRQNYHEESEQGVNDHINVELCAFHTYLSMSSYAGREDVALPGFAKFLLGASSEKMEHAQKLMKFQNDRGGRVILTDIKKPVKDEWGDGESIMAAALEVEKRVNESLLDLHRIADKHGDSQMGDFLENNYITEEVDSIKQLRDYITNLKRVGSGHGEYNFDRETLQGK